MKKLNSNLYFIEDIKWFPKEKQHRYVHLPNGWLYASHDGIQYPTKITKDDLPEWYAYGRYYKRWGYLNCKGIKDVKYRPIKMLMNHCLKDDCILLSYDKPIIKKLDSYGVDNYVYDEAVWGNELIDVLKGMRDYDGWDIQPIIEEIWQKMLTLKQLDGTTDDGFFDKYVGSRERFDEWWR